VLKSVAVSKLKLQWEEFLVLFIFILFTTQAFSVLFLTDGEASDDRQALQLAWIPAYIAILAVTLPRLYVVLAGALRAPMVVFLSVLCVFSVLWSVAPQDTARRCLAIVLSTWFGLYLGARFRQAQYLRLLAVALGVVALSSLAFALWPGWHLGVVPLSDEMAGSWRGIYMHKNSLGRHMGLALLVLAAIVPRHQFGRAYIWLAFLLVGTLLVLSRSATALFASLMAAATYAIIVVVRLRSNHRAILALVMVCAIPLAIAVCFNLDSIFRLFGRDATLSGRTNVWDLVWEFIQNRYWFGYGYQAFWVDPDGPATQLWQELKWNAPEAHNGFLEIWLGLGMIGLIAIALSLATNFILAGRAARSLDREAGYWSVLYIVFFICYNFSESLILEKTDIFWVLYVAIAVSLNAWRKRPLPQGTYSAAMRLPRQKPVATV
jgi:exopolysaccharide production protein ExoQ